MPSERNSVQYDKPRELVMKCVSKVRESVMSTIARSALTLGLVRRLSISLSVRRSGFFEPISIKSCDDVYQMEQLGKTERNVRMIIANEFMFI